MVDDSVALLVASAAAAYGTSPTDTHDRRPNRRALYLYGSSRI